MSNVSDENKTRMADALQEEAKFTSWDYVHYDRESAMTIIETFIRSGLAPVDNRSGLEKLEEANSLFDKVICRNCGRALSRNVITEYEKVAEKWYHAEGDYTSDRQCDPKDTSRPYFYMEAEPRLKGHS